MRSIKGTGCGNVVERVHGSQGSVLDVSDDRTRKMVETDHIGNLSFLRRTLDHERIDHTFTRHEPMCEICFREVRVKLEICKVRVEEFACARYLWIVSLCLVFSE